MKKLPNIHPGEILLEEFFRPLNITAYRLAKETKMPATRISEILKGKRSISVDTALRLSKFFGNSAEFWLGLQVEYDLREERLIKEKELNEIRTYNSLRVVK
jgi:addiction module HigA family antidote